MGASREVAALIAGLKAAGTCEALYIADVGITEETGVSQWNDFSGNDRHLTQATGAAQPSLQSDGPRNKRYVRFDGSDDLLDTTTFTRPSLYTVFVVTRPTVSDALNTPIFDTAGGSTNVLFTNSGVANTIDIYCGANLTTGPTVDMDEWHIIEVRAPSATLGLISILNDAPFEGSTGTSTGTGIRMGANVSGSVYGDCEIAALVMYDTSGDSYGGDPYQLLQDYYAPASKSFISSLGPVGWWDASDASTVTHVSNAVTQVDDISGNGLHLVSVGTDDPVYDDGTGAPGSGNPDKLRFITTNKSDQALATDDAGDQGWTSQPLSCLLSLVPSMATTGNTLADIIINIAGPDRASNIFDLDPGPSVRLYAGAAAGLNSGSYASNDDWMVVGGVFNGAESIIRTHTDRKLGGKFGDAGTGWANPAAPHFAEFMVGARGPATAHPDHDIANASDVGFGEGILFTKQLSPLELKAATDYLANKWIWQDVSGLISTLKSLGDIKDVWIATPQFIKFNGIDVSEWRGAVNNHRWVSDGADPLWQPDGWSDGTGQVKVETGEYLKCTTLENGETSNDWTCIIAQDQVDAATAQQFPLAFGTGFGFAMSTSGSPSLRQSVYDGTAYIKSDTDITTGEQLNTWIADSGTSTASMFKDGVADGSGSYDDTATIDSTQYLGRYPSLPSNLSELKVVCLYREALSSANRAAAEAAINSFCGL